MRKIRLFRTKSTKISVINSWSNQILHSRSINIICSLIIDNCSLLLLPRRYLYTDKTNGIHKYLKLRNDIQYEFSPVKGL